MASDSLCNACLFVIVHYYFTVCSGPSGSSLSSWKSSRPVKLRLAAARSFFMNTRPAGRRIDRLEPASWGTARADLNQSSSAVTTRLHLKHRFFSPKLSDSAHSSFRGEENMYTVQNIKFTLDAAVVAVLSWSIFPRQAWDQECFHVSCCSSEQNTDCRRNNWRKNYDWIFGKQHPTVSLNLSADVKLKKDLTFK